LVLAIAGAIGCSSDQTGSSAAGQQTGDATLAAGVSPASPEKAAASASAGKSGNELWAENCVRCHNMRDPSTYSDAQWSVAVHHMRLRADLGAEDSRKILEFLKSAN
jgi:cytochrome c553